MRKLFNSSKPRRLDIVPGTRERRLFGAALAVVGAIVAVALFVVAPAPSISAQSDRSFECPSGKGYRNAWTALIHSSCNAL